MGKKNRKEGSKIGKDLSLKNTVIPELYFKSHSSAILAMNFWREVTMHLQPHAECVKIEQDDSFS